MPMTRAKEPLAGPSGLAVPLPVLLVLSRHSHAVASSQRTEEVNFPGEAVSALGSE